MEKAVGEEYPGLRLRAIVQLVEAAEAGDADACTMAVRALQRLPGLYVATIAAVALGALDDDIAEAVVEGTSRAAGFPLPDSHFPMKAARHWASWATRAERKAYAAASFEALADHDRAAFARRYLAEGAHD